MDIGSGSGIFPDPGDPKRPDPTESGSATLVWGEVILFVKIIRLPKTNSKLCLKK